MNLTSDWVIVYDFLALGFFLLLATFLRSKIKILQKFLIPNNIIAGFLMFLLGLTTIEIFQIPADRYGKYIYHLFVITFIAMSLRKTRRDDSKSTFATGIFISASLALQVIVGLAITYIFILTFWPDLFPTSGFLLMLGFGQGPGQAYSIGSTWEPIGFENAANLGLTFAAIGYIWAIIVGLFLVKAYDKRMKRIKKVDFAEKPNNTGIIKEIEEQPSAGELSTHNSAIDGFTFQVALVLGVYLITVLALKGVEKIFGLLIQSESVVEQLVGLLWGLHFIFGALFAILIRKIMQRLGWGNIINTGLMTRISGSSLDFLVTAAIAAISISVILDYLIFIVVTTTVGGLVTLWFVISEVRKSNFGNKFERILALFGTLTGTLTTGLTLTRILDPDLKSKAARDIVFGAGIAVPFIVPVFASMIVPVLGIENGEMHKYFIINYAALVAYFIGLFVAWRYYSKKMKVPGLK